VTGGVGGVRAILTYHSIDPSGSVISMNEATFRRQAEWLANGPVRAVTVDELLEAPDEDDCIAVTFDDGLEAFGSVAGPIMRDYGLPATVFVVTGKVGGTNSWNGETEPGIPTMPLLDWAAVGRLAEEGVGIGSHTRAHPHLNLVETARLEDEVMGSAEDIERYCGRRPLGFAYPYGRRNASSEMAVAATYSWACTTELASMARDCVRHQLPRLDAFYYRRPGQLEAWGTPAFRARIGLRRAARDARGWLAARGAS